MSAQWYLLRDVPGAPRVTIGPMPTETLMDLATSGGTCSDDCACMEGVDVEITVGQFMTMVRSGTVPTLEEPSPPAGDLPDWLSDVAETEVKPPPVAANSMPDWLEEMVQDEIWACLNNKPVRPPVADASPDWLEDIQQIEQSLKLNPPPPTARPLPKIITIPVQPSDIPASLARPPAPPRQPTAPNISAPPQPPIERSPVAPLQTAPTPASSKPAPERAAPTKPPTGGAPPAARRETPGYDPETGQILDAIAYARWQKSEALRRQEELQKQPTMSVAQAFIEAQRALQEWVDADANKTLVEKGDMNRVKQSPSVLTLLARYEGYGAVMREKLLKRLDFLVDNRKKFFQAFN